MTAPKFKIVYLEEAVRFLASLEAKARTKVVYNIGKSMYVIDKDLFKKLEGTDIWEFRTLYNGMAYRLLAFWDTERDTWWWQPTASPKRRRRPRQKKSEKPKG